jgi:deoxyuridine 5''-triphosphate nucleotidohydrolase (dut)
MALRGFEIVSIYHKKDIEIPTRKTANSAGYDLAAAEPVRLEPNEVTIIPTGLKAYMLDDEYLGIHIRSGLSIRKKISLVNGQGIIDADYYNNNDNEGHIMVAVLNHSNVSVLVEKGERIAQGIFHKYLKTDQDEPAQAARSGGFGSTGEK